MVDALVAPGSDGDPVLGRPRARRPGCCWPADGAPGPPGPRLVWVNPLKGRRRYEPLARGMAASLPYMDRFLPGHNLESLEALAGTLTRG